MEWVQLRCATRWGKKKGHSTGKIAARHNDACVRPGSGEAAPPRPTGAQFCLHLGMSVSKFNRIQLGSCSTESCTFDPCPTESCPRNGQKVFKPLKATLVLTLKDLPKGDLSSYSIFIQTLIEKARIYTFIYSFSLLLVTIPTQFT